MKLVLTTVTFLLVLINLSSCKKEEAKRNTLFLDCDLIENKTELENRIIGEWNVIAVEEFDSELDWYYHTEVQYVFNDDGSGKRINPQDNSISISPGHFNYEVLEKTETGWKIAMNAIQPGRKIIQICENELLFLGAEKCIRN